MTAPCATHDDNDSPDASRTPCLRTRTLWYRYWLFGWIFDDCNQGNVFENAAALRRNRARARLLPIYIRRYATTGGCSLGLANLVGDGLSLVWQLVLISPVLVCVPLLVLSASIWSALHLIEH